MKTLTFIGGSGFIGKSFIDFFNRGLLKKYKIKKVNILCRHPKKLKSNSKINLKKVRVIKADISKIKNLPLSDVIIYAAESTDGNAYKNKNLITKKHKAAIDNFCKLVEKNKKSKILYISSGSVSQKFKINKSSSNYKQLYSQLKKYSEYKIKELKKNKIKTSIARCYTFIGPWIPLRKHYAIGSFIYDGFYKKYIEVKSNKKVFRSFMYSDDLIDWLCKIASTSNYTCPTYNVGSNKQIEIRKLALIIGKIFNKPVKFKKYFNTKIDKYVPNIDKTKRDLKLRINYDLIQSINLTINQINEKIH